MRLHIHPKKWIFYSKGKILTIHFEKDHIGSTYSLWKDGESYFSSVRRLEDYYDECSLPDFYKREKPKLDDPDLILSQAEVDMIVRVVLTGPVGPVGPVGALGMQGPPAK